MSLKTRIDNIIPRSAGVTVAQPFFRVVAAAAGDQDSDEWLSYHGDGKFECGGITDERELGRMEAYLAFIPPLNIVFVGTLIHVLVPASWLSVTALLVVAALLIASLRAIEEVSVIPAGDRA